MFIYSLPFIFIHSNLGHHLELLLIAVTLLVVLYLSAPFSFVGMEYKTLKKPYLYYYFLYALNARLSLASVFWPFFILFNLTVLGADYAVNIGIFSVGSWGSAHFMLFFPGILWSLSVWRSSENTPSRIAVAGARLMTLAVFFEYGLKAYIYTVYPKLFFGCEERMLDYLICF